MVTRLIALASGVMLALLLSMSPSWASHQYYVWTGGSYTAESDGSVDIRTYDQNGFETTAWGCASLDVTGAFSPGIRTRPGAVGALGSSSWSSCTFSGGLDNAFTQHGTWDFVATGPATKSLNDGIPGYIDGIELTMADTDFAGTVCDIDITGSADATFYEAGAPGGQRIEIHETGGSLVIEVARRPCLGTMYSGYTMDLIGTLEVDSYALINIDSPDHS